ncbi:hypothetical protein ASE17_19245 [Phenylobacterium sp. Root77]|nr:hypothetical protein ASC73_20275 [Phenylobacterium sp. Root1277]KQW94207.1 hypothetical protein ASC79_00135 [Phenylobacterium sp. Root1290]KRC38991.1 hypothetical protein ASE17_19245 [Phenylobacterium sp. Root77]
MATWGRFNLVYTRTQLIFTWPESDLPPLAVLAGEVADIALRTLLAHSAELNEVKAYLLRNGDVFLHAPTD